MPPKGYRKRLQVCSVENCKDKYYMMGYCCKHYRKWLRYGNPLIKKRGIYTKCSVEGCNNPHRVKGYCPKHYARFKNNGSPLIVKINYNHSPICSIEGCGEKYGGLGYCHKHYARLKRWGDPLKVKYNYQHYQATGEKNSQWKGGISKNKEYLLTRQKEWRHRVGISKMYIINRDGLSNTKEYKKLYKQKRKALLKNGGELSIKTIQMVYEDNIKQYGTLTCYLCFKPIEFKQDSLEHKFPLIRGGTNKYENLAVAHQKCNSKKGKKTEEEYRKVVFVR